MANALEILITGKDQFSPAAQKAQRSARGLKGQMGSLGKTVLGVGAGFLAAQASIMGVQKLFSSSIGAALKFEFQLAQIRALTGATTEDTNLLSGAIKEMARSMPKSPEELGAAAYFILSSGIEDAADAAGVLEIAAKASTIGLGETEKVADALTTVINAYGMSAGDAAHVTDVMIEAVKQGKAEASAFAGVLGRVVPLASQMGISFEEVAANLATFTRLGVSAQEAATGLRAVMNALINPTDQTRETMGELGLSVEGLRRQIKEEGLLSALDSMMTATGGNEEALAKLFPNIRALTSVLGTAGVQLEDYKDILAATENATGNLEEGFAIVSDTAQFKMQTAISQLNVLMLELGEEILPALVPAVTAVIFAFKTLGEAMAPLILTIQLIGSAFDGLGSKEDLAIEKLQSMAANAEITEAEFIELAKGIGLTADAAKELAADTSFPTQMEIWRKRAEQFGASFDEVMGAVSSDLLFLATHVGEVGTDFIDELGLMEGAGQDFQVVMEDEVAPAAVAALEAIEEAADAARSALTAMFTQTTQEEADAEAALASYKFEAGELEAGIDDLTAGERARLAQLTNDLIPAQEESLKLLRLEKDAVITFAKAQDNSLPFMANWAAGVDSGTQSVNDLANEIRTLPSGKTITLTVLMEKLAISEAEWLAEHSIEGRQHGGPVSAGQAVLVGEVRPEIFVPKTAGTILPDARAAGGGGGDTINIFAIDVEELADALMPHIRRAVA